MLFAQVQGYRGLPERMFTLPNAASKEAHQQLATAYLAYADSLSFANKALSKNTLTAIYHSRAAAYAVLENWDAMKKEVSQAKAIDRKLRAKNALVEFQALYIAKTATHGNFYENYYNAYKKLVLPYNKQLQEEIYAHLNFLFTDYQTIHQISIKEAQKDGVINQGATGHFLIAYLFAQVKAELAATNDHTKTPPPAGTAN